MLSLLPEVRSARSFKIKKMFFFEIIIFIYYLTTDIAANWLVA